MIQHIQPQGQANAQPSQPTQPTQQTNYSSEPTMNTNSSNEVLNQVALSLDNEALAIIRNASSVHAESIVNLGIKLFSKTNIYKEFMLKPSEASLDTATENLTDLVETKATVDSVTSNVSTGSSTSASTPTPTPAAGGFASW